MQTRNHTLLSGITALANTTTTLRITNSQQAPKLKLSRMTSGPHGEILFSLEIVTLKLTILTCAKCQVTFHTTKLQSSTVYQVVAIALAKDGTNPQNYLLGINQLFFSQEVSVALLLFTVWQFLSQTSFGSVQHPCSSESAQQLTMDVKTKKLIKMLTDTCWQNVLQLQNTRQTELQSLKTPDSQLYLMHQAAHFTMLSKKSSQRSLTTSSDTKLFNKLKSSL